MIFALAVRNLFRWRRRSLLTSMTMVAGFLVLSFTLGLSEGGYDSVISLFTDLRTGHVQLVNKTYLQNPGLLRTIPFDADLSDKIMQVGAVKAVSPRVEGGGLAFFDKASIGLEILGVDPAREVLVSSLYQRIAKGQWFSKSGAYQALVGKGVADQLGLELGAKVALISQGADGSMSTEFFTVIGIMKKNNVDDFSLFTDVASAQDFFVLQGKVHRIVIQSEDFKDAVELATVLSRKFGSKVAGVFEPWQAIEEEFFRSMEADKEGNKILYIIIGMVVGLGVLNTVLMSILERRREFGILKALGTRPWQIFLMIILETAILSIISCIVGFIFAFCLNYYLSIYGIKFSEPIDVGGIGIKTMLSTVDYMVFVVPLFVVFLSALMVAIIPAIRAASQSPGDAMRGL
tara:strand:+ start:390 stop:1601 length:1212 start_codon:yes stop_codon:yes gene_type:complete